MKPNISFIRRRALIAIAAAISSTAAQAASDSWDGSTSAVWNLGTNWLSDTTAPGVGETATFNGAGNGFTTIDLGGGVSGGGIVFDTAGVSGYTIGSGAVGSQALSLGTGITMNSSVANNQLINANVLLNGNVGLTNESVTNGLTIAGGMTATTAGAKVITISGAGNTALSGELTSGSGSLNLIKTGSGTLTLSNSGTSTIASNLLLSGGLLRITAGNHNVIQNNGNNTQMNNGADLEVSGGALNISGAGGWFPVGNTAGQTSTFTVSGGAVSVTNNFGTQVGRLGGGELTITSGSFTNNDSIGSGIYIGEDVAASGTVNLDGGNLITNQIRGGLGSGNEFHFNGGTLKPTLNRADWFANNATLATEVRNGGAVIDTAGFNVTIGDVIAHSTVGGDNAIDGGLTKQGLGQLTLSNANTYTGATQVSGGILVLTNSGALGSGAVSVAAGARLYLDANSLTVPNNISLNGVTTGGALTSGDRPPNNNTILTGQITLNADSNITSWWNDKSMTLSGKITGAGGLIIERAMNLSGGTAGNGPKMFISGATNDYAGNTTINGSGTLVVITANSALSSGTVTIAAGARLYLDANNMTISNNIVLNGVSAGGALTSGDRAANNNNTVSGQITLNADSNITSWWNDKSLTLSGKITGNGGLILERPTSLAGTTPNNGTKIIISGTTNDYLGNTTVNGGGAGAQRSLVQLGAANALPATTTLTLANGILAMNGNNQTLSGLVSAIATDAVVNGNATAATLTVNNTSGNTFNGVLGGAAANENNFGFTKDGAGNLTLNGANTYTGVTTVKGGTLSLGAGGTISSSLVLGSSTPTAGLLDVTSKAAYSQTNVNGNGTINIGSGKTVTVTGNLAPGFSAGSFMVTGNLALAGTTITTMEIGGSGGVAGTDFDYINVTGSSSLDGVLSIISYNGYDLTQMGTYNLFDATSFAGDFDAVSVGGNPLSLSSNVWIGSFGASTYSFSQADGVLNVTVVPEPGAILLTGLSLIGLLRRRRA